MKKVLSIMLTAVASSGVLAHDRGDTSFGLGVGAPYGMFGLNISHAITKKIDLTGGVGYGWSVGARFRPLTSAQNLRLSAIYGTNSMLELSGEDAEYFEGMNFGIGYGGLEGWDIDLMYVMISDDAKDRIDELKSQNYSITGDTDDTVKLSFGYHW